jgi:Cu/Ag efflux pump CusA
MNSSSNSTDRRPGEYFLFALAFLAFLVAVAGVIVSSLPIAVSGGVLLLLCVVGFRGRPA